MNKTLVKTALTLTTKSFQTRSLCRAINFLIKPNANVLKTGSVLKLNLHDFKKVWFVKLVDQEFKPTKSKLDDIEIRTDFDSLMLCREKSKVSSLLNNGSILLLGDKQVSIQVTDLLTTIPQEKLDNLFNKFSDFFNKKQKEVSKLKISTLDFDNISLSDIKTNDDIDFIRDEALRIENLDMPTSLKLMEIAHKARPEGPFIKKKVLEYREKLNKDV